MSIAVEWDGIKWKVSARGLPAQYTFDGGRFYKGTGFPANAREASVLADELLGVQVVIGKFIKQLEEV